MNVRKTHWRWLLALGLVVLLATAAWFMRRSMPVEWTVRARLMWHGVSVDRDVHMRMADGVELAATVYLPRRAAQPLPTILIRLPYGKDTYGEALGGASFFARHGYAVVVQDVRGKHASGGRFIPWQHATEDGARTLDWIVAQPWSNGRVGTWGCSALGELQYSLARARHPAHAAMMPLGAGGGAGSVGGLYGYFGVYEGGVMQLASAFGWLAKNGAAEPNAPPLAGPLDLAAALRTLPVSEMVPRLRPDVPAWTYFTEYGLDDPRWDELDYVRESDRLATPTLDVNTWGDQTLEGTLALADHARRTAPNKPHHVVIGPGNHCDTDGRIRQFGQLPVENAERAWQEETLAWFDAWLKQAEQAPPALPRYRYFVLGENRWRSSDRWPPQDTVTQRWYLDSDGAAQSGSGDGRLRQAAPKRQAVDLLRHDPMDPVPSRGGPVCCTGNPSDVPGPADQADVESRRDVLVYTSEPLTQALTIAGPLSVRLSIDSDAADTDVIARLAVVDAAGRSLGLQEGALRLSHDRMLKGRSPETRVQRHEIEVSMRSIAYTVPAGHRLRLHIASSSFPRLERHLGMQDANRLASRPVPAQNQLHHGPDTPSYLILHVVGDQSR